MSDTLLVVQHVDREGPDLIGRLAVERGMTIQCVRPDRGDALPEPADIPNAIALVLGGPMSVNDRLQPDMPWLQRELDWLTLWYQQSKPVLGICLGAQLLAVAAGGTVEPLTVGEPRQPLKEVGFGAIHWVVDPSEEPLLQGLNPSEPVLHWHGDRILLPDEATLLGSSLHCREQVFRIGHHAIGLQCHLEISASSLERWITEDRDYVVNAMGPDGPEALRSTWMRLGPTIQRQGQIMFNSILNRM